MLRVGLTGELGSGKSTVARMFAEHGAVVLSSDEIARAMMQPGEPIFGAVVAHFGAEVLASDGSLDRAALARLAFDPVHPRVEELNALVHPGVIAEGERRMASIAAAQPGAIVVLESALLFTTRYAGGEEPWRTRFDRIVLVTAPDALKVERFVERCVARCGAREAGGGELAADGRAALAAEARRRLAAQRIPTEARAQCLWLENDRGMDQLRKKVEDLWKILRGTLTLQA